VRATNTRPPWHFWVVGPFFVLLYSGGAYDYVMTHRHDAAYFASQGYDDSQIAYFTDYPLVPDVFWTVAVWGALCAAVLLLFRSRWAMPVVLVALIFRCAWMSSHSPSWTAGKFSDCGSLCSTMAYCS
jgi:hypothetical protein